jgi:hypothetical protein
MNENGIRKSIVLENAKLHTSMKGVKKNQAKMIHVNTAKSFNFNVLERIIKKLQRLIK